MIFQQVPHMLICLLLTIKQLLLHRFSFKSGLSIVQNWYSKNKSKCKLLQILSQLKMVIKFLLILFYFKYFWKWATQWSLYAECLAERASPGGSRCSWTSWRTTRWSLHRSLLYLMRSLWVICLSLAKADFSNRCSSSPTAGSFLVFLDRRIGVLSGTLLLSYFLIIIIPTTRILCYKILTWVISEAHM